MSVPDSTGEPPDSAGEDTIREYAPQALLFLTFAVIGSTVVSIALVVFRVQQLDKSSPEFQRVMQNPLGSMANEFLQFLIEAPLILAGVVAAVGLLGVHLYQVHSMEGEFHAE